MHVSIYHKFIFLICGASLSCALLAGCGPKQYSGDSPYGQWMVEGESVKEVIKDGPFTVLRIDYLSPFWSYFNASVEYYYKIVYRDRVFVKKVTQLGQWTGASSPAFFVRIYENGWVLYLVHEVAGKPVLQIIHAGELGWDGEEGYEYGYPLSDNVRYFPPSLGTLGNGFLMTSLPFSVKKLPSVVRGGRGPSIRYLAAIAPDGKSVAYADDPLTPSVLMVSDDAGVIHDPIPVPVADTSTGKTVDVPGITRLWRWFPTAFEWKRNTVGQWEVVQRPSAAAASSQANPVEELFLDADIGYRNCFAATSMACLTTWQRIIDDDTQKSAGNIFTPPYEYAALKPVQAFGANVGRLQSGVHGRANYALFLDASAEKVTAELITRLKSRKIAFVRADQCPRGTQGDAECAASLNKRLGWQLPVDHEFLMLVASALQDPQQTVFILPTLLLMVRPDTDGKSMIVTVSRYNRALHRKHKEGEAIN